MWIASTAGFFSIVRKIDHARGDSRRPYQIRARDRRDLVALQKLVSEIRRVPILETPEADYRWRLIVSDSQIGWVFARLAETIEYPNFKATIQNTPVQSEKIGLYNQVWDIMAGHQAFITGDSVAVGAQT